MGQTKRTILITGCSAGGIGDYLAQEFHRRGLRVFATARSLPKIAHLKAMGLDTLTLDVTDTTSIAAAVEHVAAATGGSLDILLNNSGSGYSVPITDANLETTRALFEVNVFAVLAVTQAFIPLLLRGSGNGTGKGMIVNHTSVASVVQLPFQGIYAATKAAAASLTANMRQELKPFGIKVVEMKTGRVQSKFFDNAALPPLPKDSLYEKAQAEVEDIMRGGTNKESGWMPVETFARKVVGGLLGGHPGAVIWRGGSASVVWFATAVLPLWAVDALIARTIGLPAIARKLRGGQSEGK